MTSGTDLKAGSPDSVVIGARHVTVADVSRVAVRAARVVLSEEPAYRARLGESVKVLERFLEAGGDVYGVTTGVGDSVDTGVPSELVEELPLNLLRFHGCGTGRVFDQVETRAIMLARLVSLANGASAVRPTVLETLSALINRQVLPRIPEEGSVGASGDLTPLSYIAAVMSGEREVVLEDGRVCPASEGLAFHEIAPVRLGPKESLALMNGTSVMTGLACLALDRASQLARFAAALTAVASDTMRGRGGHFDDRIFALKPHPGQRRCAGWIRADLEYQPGCDESEKRLQDRYSLRCAPHVIGVLLDNLRPLTETVEIELNSVNDNPLFDIDSGDVLHGGNFYGGHICQAMDTLKTCVANLADLADRQLALLCNVNTNAGLPSNLVMPSVGPTHHGFKAMQISASALTAEALKLTMPASVFSRSTENHNQDKVSMGTIAARDCLRVLELTETVLAIHSLALCQAVDLRGPESCKLRSRELHRELRRHVRVNDGDRRMDSDIQKVLALYRSGELPLGRAGA